jgi:hypothetical protein
MYHDAISRGIGVERSDNISRMDVACSNISFNECAFPESKEGLKGTSK